MTTFTIELPSTFEFVAKAAGAEPLTFDLRSMSIAGLRYAVEYGIRQSITDSFAGAQAATDKWVDTAGKEASPAEVEGWKRTWCRDRAVARFQAIKSGAVVLSVRAPAGPDPVRVAGLVELLTATPALAGSARRPTELKKLATAIATAADESGDGGDNNFAVATARRLVEAAAKASLFAPTEDALGTATDAVATALAGIIARLRTPAPAIDLGALFASP